MVKTCVSAPVCGMGIERAPIGDDQALGGQRLDADVVGAGGDRALDLGAQQLLEHAEQRVLQIDGERQQPVEEGRDRRQLLAQAAVLVGQMQAGRVLESLQRAALDLAGEQQQIELAQAARA